MDRRYNTGTSNRSILERDKRLAALNALVSRLAHDFNNSIAPLLGWFSIIQAEAGESSEIGTYAAKGEQIARSSEQALQDIMNAVKPERSFHPIQTDFKKIIDEELLVLQKAIPPSVNLDIECKIDECTIVTDPNHWRKAISNLLNNARYGLALGGRLKVLLEKVDLTEEEKSALGVKGNNLWKLEVEDDGLGMSEEVLDRAFEPFFSTRPKSQSSGLGLTHLHSLVKLQGGQVIIESEEGKGTKVVAWFCSEPVSSQSDQKSLRMQHRVSKNSKKILLVDDDPLVLEVLKMFLQKNKYDVITAINGVNALEVFKKRVNEIGLIITDVRMAEMNGVEFVKLAKGMKNEIPVLFISGERDSVLNELMAGFDEKPKLIKKPCSLKEFLSAVNEIQEQKNSV